MPKAIDLTGDRFDKLVVVELAESGGGSRAGRRWLCKCDCGETRIVSTGHLRAGTSACLACLKKSKYDELADRRMDKAHAEDGMRFGSYLVLRPDRNPNNGKLERLVRCTKCGTEKHVSVDVLKAGRARSCEDKCRGRNKTATHWRRLRTTEPGKVYGQLTVLRIFKGPGGKACAVCCCACGHEGFRVLLSSLKSGNTKGCGCLQHIVPPERRGENHPWYRHDLTDEERINRRVFEGQDAFRSFVFKRDDYTCQACGKRGGTLAAHHIKPWAYHKGCRFYKRNLVTLCDSCHDAFHIAYGRQNPDIWRYMVPWIRERREETGFGKL